MAESWGKEDASLAKLAIFQINDCTKMAQRVIESKLPDSKTLDEVLQDPEVNQKLLTLKTKKRILNETQWNVLYREGGVHMSEIDMTLAMVLFRYLPLQGISAPATTGWDKMPVDTDKSLAANMVRLRFYRNEFSHKADAKRFHEKFELMWGDRKKTILNIVKDICPEELESYKKRIEDLKDAPIESPKQKQAVETLFSQAEADLAVLAAKVDEVLDAVGDLATKGDVVAMKEEVMEGIRKSKSGHNPVHKANIASLTHFNPDPPYPHTDSQEIEPEMGAFDTGKVQVSEASNPAKVKVHGPAVEQPVNTFTSTYMIVDCREAGPGEVAISLTDERGLDFPVRTTDQKDNTFRIEFEPSSVGTYHAIVFFANKEIPSSPFKVIIAEKGAASGGREVEEMTGAMAAVRVSQRTGETPTFTASTFDIAACIRDLAVTDSSLV